MQAIVSADFYRKAQRKGVKPVAGDFNNDGFCDIALTGIPSWTTIPLALFQADGTVRSTEGAAPGFNSLAGQDNVRTVAGDFNGDGLGDVALVGGNGWTTIPVAFGIGGGRFSVTNWSVDKTLMDAISVVSSSKTHLHNPWRPLSGDFNGDGYSDIAISGIGFTSGIGASIPVVFSTGDGEFEPTYGTVSDGAAIFASEADGDHVVSGDFDGDRTTDVAVTEPGATADQTITTDTSDGDGNFNVTPTANPDFGSDLESADVVVPVSDSTMGEIESAGPDPAPPGSVTPPPPTTPEPPHLYIHSLVNVSTESRQSNVLVPSETFPDNELRLTVTVCNGGDSEAPARLRGDLTATYAQVAPGYPPPQTCTYWGVNPTPAINEPYYQGQCSDSDGISVNYLTDPSLPIFTPMVQAHGCADFYFSNDLGTLNGHYRYTFRINGGLTADGFLDYDCDTGVVDLRGNDEGCLILQQSPDDPVTMTAPFISPAPALSYRQGWEHASTESTLATWFDASGTPPLLASDPTAPTESTVQLVNRFSSGFDYASGLVAVDPGTTYCVGASARSLTGDQPFVGVARYDDTITALQPAAGGVALMGAAGQIDSAGVVTPIRTTGQWRGYAKEIVMPSDTAFVRIADGIAGTGGTAPQVYFDDLGIWEGPCPTVTAPPSITAFASGPSGAVVAFHSEGSDPQHGTSLPVSCSPSSGSMFPVGTTIVGCSVTNSDGITASNDFAIEVLPNELPIPVINLGSRLGQSVAVDINNAGTIVGSDAPGDTNATLPIIHSTVAQGVLWTPGDLKMTPIPSSAAGTFPAGVNEAGAISGTYVDSSGWITAGRYDPSTDSVFHSINAAGEGGRINNAGQMTGHGYDSVVGHSMFRATATTVPLAVMPGFYFTVGEDIDQSGSIVGWGYLNDPYIPQALRYSDANGSENLNLLNNVSNEGGPWSLSKALATNGTAIVGLGVHDGAQHAFLFEPGVAGAANRITDLGMPPTWPHDSYVTTSMAHDISADGVVVGALYDLYGSWPYVAIVWTKAGKMVDLNTWIDPSSGWYLTAAYAINDNHDVVGWGRVNGAARGFKLHLPDSVLAGN